MASVYLNCEYGVSGDMVLNALIGVSKASRSMSQEIGRIGEAVGALTRGEDADPHHFHRSYRRVLEIIDDVDVPDDVRAVARRIYEVIAAAESKVHGHALNDLHFHEVGRDQAIVNVLGVASCIVYNGIDQVLVSEICDGHGTVQCAHGELQIPVPAVKAMLDACDLDYRQTEYEGEMVTPSGLAMLIGTGAVTSVVPEETPVRTFEAFGARKFSDHGLVAQMFE